MMNTLQKTYNCLFQFDCKNKKINVLSASKKPLHSPIHLSYDNLIKNANITELSDEVVTSLAGYGSGDNMSISYVNPNGTDRIYNLDYLINHGDIDDKLADRWIAYKDTYDFYQKAFSNLEALRIEKTSAHQLANAQLSIIQKDIQSLEGSIISIKADTTVEGWEAHLKKKEEELALLKKKFIDQQAVVQKYNTDKTNVETQIKNIVDVCRLESYFTDEELTTLSMFFKEDTIVEDSFVVPAFNSALQGDSSSIIEEKNKAMLKIAGTVVESNNLAEIFEVDENGNFVGIDPDGALNVTDPDRHDQIIVDQQIQDAANTVAQQLNENKNKYVYSLRGGSLEFTQKVFTTKDGKEEVSNKVIKGSIVSASFQYNVDNLSTYIDETSAEITKKGYFLLTVALRNAYQNDSFYPSMNITLSGMIQNDTPQINDNFIGFNIVSGTFYNTAGVTEFQQHQVYQELYDYVKDALKKLSEPSYQFSIDSANFIFAKTFEEFKNKLTLGRTISADINGDSELETIVYPILIEVSFSYDDYNNFSLTFSDKYKLSCPEFQFADLFSETVTSSKGLDLNKASYNSFVNSGAIGAIDSLSNDAYDVAKKAIINSSNQGIEWNSSGLYLRKKVEGGFDQEQIAMINNMIAFTGDGWNSVKLAIGKFKDTNVGDTWGIAAPNITGTLFAGKNLVIENTVTNPEGTKIVKQFKVDETGVWLNNSALYFAQDLFEGSNGGKMLLDPQYGFAAGNKDLFAGEANNIKPSFIDENGKMLYDEMSISQPDGTVRKIAVPKNSSFFFDINTGNSYFKGDIYATNGYFAGTINATDIIAGTLNGTVIKDGTINVTPNADGSGNKLTGSISEEQIYENVIAAINKYIKFQTDKGKPIVQMGNAVIGELEASHISGSVIEAINNGKGLINADKVQAGSMVAGSLVISGEKGRLAIDPKYGIVAGNEHIFQIGENGKITNPTFVDEKGNLIFDKDASAPKNTSFYFDINTGCAYFSGKLSASDISTGKLSSEYLSIKDGFITNAMISNLQADKITAGTIGSDVILSSVLTSLNAAVGQINGEKLTFKDGYIKSAWIENLSADKLTAGRINTQQIQIGYGDAGKEALLINDKLIQWRDKNHKIRLQAGQDKSGNYTFAVFGENGETAIFDEAGINAEGIKKNILVDNMFKPIDLNGSYQGISGDKLNISSVVSSINSKDNKTLIEAGHLSFDHKGLQVTVDKILTDFDGTIDQHTTNIQANSDAISATAGKLQQKIDDDKLLIQDINSKFEAMPDKISSTVENFIANVQIGGRNLLTIPDFRKKEEGAETPVSTTEEFEPNTITVNGITLLIEEGEFYFEGTNTKTDSDWEFCLICERARVLKSNTSYVLSTTKPLATGLEIELQYLIDDQSQQILNSKPLGENCNMVGDDKISTLLFTSDVNIKESDYLVAKIKVKATCGALNTSFRIKLEQGNKSTGWSYAPEDIANIGNSLESMGAEITHTKSEIQQLSDSITSMVFKDGKQSVITQDENGWILDISPALSSVTTQITENRERTEELAESLNIPLDTLASYSSFIEQTNYYPDPNNLAIAQPCLLLGHRQEIGENKFEAVPNSFQLRITNTAIDFLQVGNTTPLASLNSDTLHINTIDVENDLTIGQEWKWAERADGNLGLRWEG